MFINILQGIFTCVFSLELTYSQNNLGLCLTFLASNTRHSWSLLLRPGKCSRDDINPSSFVIIKSNKFEVSRILCRLRWVTCWHRKHSWIVLTKLVRWCWSPSIKRWGLSTFVLWWVTAQWMYSIQYFLQCHYSGYGTQPQKMFVLVANFISTLIWSLYVVCMHISEDANVSST